MFIVRLHDDTPGYKETFYKGPFETEEAARIMCNKFNSAYVLSDWSARMIEAEEMPRQFDWEKRVFSEYDA